MSGTHGHALFVHSDSPIHRTAPQVKLVVAFLCLFAVIATPREAFWAFALYALALGTLVAIARIPIRFLLSRMIVLAPFMVLAVLFPLLGPPPDATVLGLQLSVAGLWDMWNLLAKAGLGLLAAVILGATTEAADLLRGMSSLRIPGLVTAILGFMVRYVDVIIGDLTRMRLALASRGHQSRGPRDWAPYGRAAGTMFIRTYERGERIYLAMESRGYAGEIPASARAQSTSVEWALGLGLVLLFWLAAALSRVSM